MAIKPGVDHRPINYSGVPRISRYDIVSVHTIVGYAPAPAAHFSTKADGYQIQNRDTAYQSAANLNGNHRIIAIENEDHGSAYGSWNTNDGHAVPAFTEAQCESIADILAWCYFAHGIPLVLVADSQSSRRGISYHRQGIKGNWAGYAYQGWTAGETWSSSQGKVCPGDRRIKQLIEIIIPRARVMVGLEEDVALSDTEHKWLEDVLRRVQSMHLYGFGAFDPNKVPPPAWQSGGDLAPIWKSMDSPDAEGGSKRLDDIDSNVKTLQAGGVSADELVAAMAVNQQFLGNLAGAIADEMDRRNRDGDPNTGQAS